MTQNPDAITATVSRACQLSGLGRTSIYALIKTGRLKSSTVGKRRLILLASLREVIENGALLDAPQIAP